MKILILAFGIVVTSFAFAQEWAPIGTIWHYNYLGSSYSTFESVGDSLYSGQLCRHIQKSKNYNYDYLGYRPESEFTYYSNDTVYYYDEILSDFRILYDFGASPGDSWYYHFKSDSYVGDIDSVLITVDSIDNTIVNSTTLRRLHVHYDTLSYEGTEFFSFPMSSSIIESIGDTLNMFYLFAIDASEFETPTPYGLRCYEDPIIGFHDFAIVDSCSWVNFLGHTESPIEGFQVYPNPVKDILRVVVEGDVEPSEFSILDPSGKIVLKGKLTSEIDLSSLTSGIYYLNVGTDSNIFSTRLIVQ